MDKPKIYVRERVQVHPGEKRPRFAVVAVSNINLRIYLKHIRKMEVERIAADIGAEVVYLQAGKDDMDLDDEDD